MAAKQSTVSRRSILVGVGAAAATAAVAAAPAVASFPKSAGITGRTWEEMLASWPSLLAEFRAPYLAEVARFAETLRPRFESGELHAYATSLDDPDDEPDHPVAMDALEELVREHFGLQVKEIKLGWWEGDEERARLVLALSPSTEATNDSWSHPALHAAFACAWDVVLAARAAGYYVPAVDEMPYPGYVEPAEAA